MAEPVEIEMPQHRQPIRTYIDNSGHRVDVYAPGYAMGVSTGKNYGGWGESCFY